MEALKLYIIFGIRIKSNKNPFIMKKSFLILLSILTISVFGQITDTINTKSKISNVTVFFNGAQVHRQVSFNATKGSHILRIDDLTEGLDAESILVKEIKSCKTLSVKHETNSKNGKEDEAEIETIVEQIKEVKLKIKQLSNESSVCDIEERLLLDNSKLGKTDNGVSIATLKEAADFYRVRMTEIRQNKLLLGVKIQDELGRFNDLTLDINRLKSKSSKVYSQLFINIDCEDDVSGKFEISYYITSAGWEPIYDFRVNEINKPLSIDYNANIFQSTGEEWKDVKLKLSTNNPSLNNEKPDLETWYIDKRKIKKRKSKRKPPVATISGHGTLKGTLRDKDTKEPIPFANIILEDNGTQIGGTSSDFDGNYTIKPLPAGTFSLKASNIEYNPFFAENVVIYDGLINFFDIEMQGGAIDLSEVQIVEYSVPLIQKDQTSTGAVFTKEDIRYNSPRFSSGGGVSSQETYKRNSIRGARNNETVNYIDGVKVIGSANMPASSIEYVSKNYLSKQVSKKLSNLEYEIKSPFTIPSDGKDYILKIKDVFIPVDYVHYIVPKKDESAFLTAQIPHWNELDLLSGKSSIYYQGTFIGESSINASFQGDTLGVSLGRDRDILVSRKGNKEKLERKILGRYIKETISWDIEIKNNKDKEVQVILEDQYPLAEKESVEIELIEISGAKINDKTGKLVWDLELKPKEKKTLNITYTVKYPKYIKLYMD